MHLLATGFVETAGGSVASANGLLLASTLSNGHSVEFFTKPTFVDPRPAVESNSNAESLTVVDVTNHFFNNLRSNWAPRGIGVLNRCLVGLDAATYNRGIVKRMRTAKGELDLWLGDWARGRGGRPVLSYVQGPPGTDARSVFQHGRLIRRLAGTTFWLKLALYAKYRLTFGMPTFKFSDQLIVGSCWSQNWLIGHRFFAEHQIHRLPYPIDLQQFTPSPDRRRSDEPLRLLWLGRIVPRKRLDLFLNALSAAIQDGCNVEAWVIGQCGFVPGYERLIQEFKFPQHLKYQSHIPRSEVASLFSQVDILVQPSEEENFGSSVAEALACGVPCIVGTTNGTGDYICNRSVMLKNYTVQELTAAIEGCAEAKLRGDYLDPVPSRTVAEHWFAPSIVSSKFESILNLAAQGRN